MIIQCFFISVILAAIVQADPNPHGGVIILPFNDKHESNGQILQLLTNRQAKSFNVENKVISKETNSRQGKSLFNGEEQTLGQGSLSIYQNKKNPNRKIHRKGKSIPQANKQQEGNVPGIKADSKKITPQRQGKAILKINDKTKKSPGKRIQRKGKAVSSNKGYKQTGEIKTKNYLKRRGKAVPHTKAFPAEATKTEVQRKGKAVPLDKKRTPAQKSQVERKGKKVRELNEKTATDDSTQAQSKIIMKNNKRRRQGKAVFPVKENIDDQLSEDKNTARRKQRQGKSNQALKYPQAQKYSQKISPSTLQLNSHAGRNGRIFNGKPKNEDKFNHNGQADIAESSDKLTNNLNEETDKTYEEKITKVNNNKDYEVAKSSSEKVAQGVDTVLEENKDRQGKSLNEDVQVSKLKITMRTGPVRPDGLRAESIIWFE